MDKNALSVRSSRLSPSGLSIVNFPPCDWRHNILCVSIYLYTLGKRSSKGSTLTLSNTSSHFDRKTDDHSGAASQQSASAFMKRKNTKNILGLEYKYVPSAWWNAMLMGKHYLTSVRGPVLVEEVGRRPYYAERSRTVSALGVGAAGTLRLPRGWQWKVSYEHGRSEKTSV